jgi:tRNA(fMet)-specific endonuclease VapC
MAMYLLDTNHASPLVTPHHPLRQRVVQQLDTGDSFAICVPVLTETIFGMASCHAHLKTVQYGRTYNPRFPCYIPDETGAELAADLQIALRRHGRQLATVDALIAVITLRYDLILLTTDGDFHAVPNLQYENWLQPQ